MRLHRFTASSNHKAISMIQDALGPDALVYSTRSVPEGIEMIAGLPDETEQHGEYPVSEFSSQDTLPRHGQGKNEFLQRPANQFPDFSLIEKLNKQLQIMNERVENLSKQVGSQLYEGFHISDDEHTTKRNLLFYHLTKLGFRGKFCQLFINRYFQSRNISDPVSFANIESDLRHFIQTMDDELIDDNRVCALIGPTGIGKTTTILKLAKRYLSKYGSDSLGIITTDYHDISGKNLLLHYQNIYNIDLEYADSPVELAMVIKSMRNKRLVLIDTHGVSQRDADNVARLRDLMEGQRERLTTHLVLPCNVQEPILDEIARGFKTTNMSGCILTKADECISMAPVLSVCINYGMKIAYICNGQNINTDIEIADPDAMLYQIMTESQDKKKSTEEHLLQNLVRISNQFSEGRYERS
ncbi:Flagellar biosynthesis protein FlhF [Aquicella siphonis]|uniref:Flagellar biosynthesis protein FlhF n=1 Tax=Aquicella siphonis TaxID=254247 RepID=A0A5E4PLL2_9COXI|nr:hypothetical protein [Aquicella siphonis]VVC77116.1 Flagellar biosynthesis protein FlhF [Aquicella siphonis]